MPSVQIPEETFQKLIERAAALNLTLEELVRPALEQLTQTGGTAPQSPLTGEAWKRELESWKRDAASRADRYPPGHVVDDSRETIYGEREDSQL